MKATALRRCCVVVLLGLAHQAIAHHAFAMFDQGQQVVLHGSVREFQWNNPHAFIHLEVPNSTGGTDVWLVEMNSPNNLRRQGWKSGTLKPGDRVTLVINPLRDGQKGGLFVRVTLADGTVLDDPTRRGGGPINVPTAK